MLTAKQRNIEPFIEHHRTLRESYQRIVEYGQSGSELFTATKDLAIEQWIADINTDFFRFLQDNSPENKQRLNDNIGKIDKAVNILNEDQQTIVYDYILSLSQVILETEETHKYFLQAINQDTIATLDSLELA